MRRGPKTDLQYGEIWNGRIVKPKTKIVVLTVSLILPYLALVEYVAFRSPDNTLPIWLCYFGLSYILGTMIVVMAFSRRIYRAGQMEKVDKPKSGMTWKGRAGTGYLIALWSGCFLWGAYQTILGNLDWRRAVPAGAFLLAFIALFSWSLYKDLKRPTQQTKPTDENTTNKV
jgi:hypothetical protein